MEVGRGEVPVHTSKSENDQVVQRRDQGAHDSMAGTGAPGLLGTPQLPIGLQCIHGARHEDEPLRVGEAISSHPHKCLVGTSLEVQG